MRTRELTTVGTWIILIVYIKCVVSFSGIDD